MKLEMKYRRISKLKIKLQKNASKIFNFSTNRMFLAHKLFMRMYL